MTSNDQKPRWVLCLALTSALAACNADDGSSPDTSVRAGSSGVSLAGGAGVSQAGSAPSVPQGGHQSTAGSDDRAA